MDRPKPPYLPPWGDLDQHDYVALLTYIIQWHQYLNYLEERFHDLAGALDGGK